MGLFSITALITLIIAIYMTRAFHCSPCTKLLRRRLTQTRLQPVKLAAAAKDARSNSTVAWVVSELSLSKSRVLLRMCGMPISFHLEQQGLLVGLHTTVQWEVAHHQLLLVMSRSIQACKLQWLLAYTV